MPTQDEVCVLQSFCPALATPYHFSFSAADAAVELRVRPRASKLDRAVAVAILREIFISLPLSCGR